MKIGDRVFVQGYVDEIRRDIVIIRNEGGYFGTLKSEIISNKDIIQCKDCAHWKMFNYCPMIDRTTSENFFCADGKKNIDL